MKIEIGKSYIGEAGLVATVVRIDYSRNAVWYTNEKFIFDLDCDLTIFEKWALREVPCNKVEN